MLHMARGSTHTNTHTQTRENGSQKLRSGIWKTVNKSATDAERKDVRTARTRVYVCVVAGAGTSSWKDLHVNCYTL